MNEILLVMPWLASFCGAVMIAKALRLLELNPRSTTSYRNRVAILVALMFTLPTLAHAQGVDLQTAVESGNAIIMYLCGVLAAVGIVAAGVAMMMGRQSIAKWAFAGGMVSGLGFAIVRTMWANFGIAAPDVTTFAP